MTQPLPRPVDNPLLHVLDSGEPGVLPAFDRVRAEHVEPAMRWLLADLEGRLTALETGAEPAWDALVEPLERLSDDLDRVWGVVSHLLGVRNSDELRAAQELMQPDVVRFGMRMAQSEPLYRALAAIKDGSEWARLSPARQRAISNHMRAAELAGVALEPAARERFNELQTELAELSTRFVNNVLDATKEFELVLTESAEVDGLPASVLDQAAQSARTSGHEAATAEAGPWRFTLDIPSYLGFLKHARRRDLRERLHRAQVTRASAGDRDNSPVLERILELRREVARLLSYDCYADVSLASKMASSQQAVRALQEELRAAAHPAAERDFAEMAELARELGAPEGAGLETWDAAFWSERLREERFDYTEEQLKVYFPLPRVLEGLFALTRRLFGIAVVPADGEAPVWHEDVRFFRMQDAEGRPVAAFYLDPYARPEEKRGGAWMDDCVGRSRTREGVRLPVAHLVCNGTPPLGDEPSLMTWGEVNTLFHEFGHGLQHMLTTIDEGLVAGISGIEWDAVELASQFMENWCFERPVVADISGHVETGEPLPDELFEKLAATRTFQQGSGMLRQLYFGILDFELHSTYSGEGESALDVQKRVAETTTIIPPLPEDRFLCAFSHIFGGGYAAGYYSYKWAEVLSADAFGAFEEVGLDDSAAVAIVGRKYRDTILAMGGSRHPMEVFREFRGREPSTEALLRHAGLVTAG